MILDSRSAAPQPVHSVEAWRQNLLPPVYRVPPEILVHIFKIIRVTEPEPEEALGRDNTYHDNPEANASIPPPPVTYGFIKVTQVCHDWRLLALCTPALWTSIDLRMGVHWFIEMLERSQSQPIAVDARFIPDSISSMRLALPQYDIRNVNWLLSDEFQRIKNLTILFHEKMPVGDEIDIIFSSSALVLESLYLEVPHRYHSTKLFSLPAEMFSFDAPRLRSVSFTGCAFDNITAIPFFRNVTYFCCIGSWEHTSFSVDELFALLQQMPSLTHLKLAGCLPVDEDQFLEASYFLSRNVDLLHLSHLTLDGNIITCAEIIGAIRTFKPLTLLNLHCEDLHAAINEPEEDGDRHMLLLLPEIIAASLDVDLPVHSLRFYCFSRGLSVEFTPFTLNDELGPLLRNGRLRRDGYRASRRGFSLEFQESYVLTNDDVEEFMQALLRSLPLENVEMLSFGIDFSPTPELFLALSNCCGQLRHVRLSAKSAPDFVSSLELPNLTGDYLFPQLRCIIADNFGSVDHQSFIHHLRVRKDAGTPIQTLWYSGLCSMDDKYDEYLRELAEIIPEIHFFNPGRSDRPLLNSNADAFRTETDTFTMEK